MTVGDNIVQLLVIGLVLALYVLPFTMAIARRRSVIIWGCVTIFLSPFAAIILLLILGDAPGSFAKGTRR
ncbi:hypothetical protein [Ruegeria sp. HKCCA6707]|uniref:hypothetical protein n=1 Tax=Ruegeria sp. HKCCA6707 TaxID=2682996 RepID=UPI001489CAC4|nr:hypothetical protein [Ruegeria sp. HKCCA6707]